MTVIVKNFRNAGKAMFILAIVMIVTTAAIAQTDPGGGGIGDPDPTEQVPIDGGLALLVAAGVGLGGRQIYLQRKKKLQQVQNVKS